MKFLLRVIKPLTPEHAERSVIEIEGRDVGVPAPESVLAKVIDVEQWLERMFGYRFHILQSPFLKEKTEQNDDK